MPKLFFRTAILEPDTDLAKTGVVRLSFASEAPVLRNDKKRGKYWEVLSHAPGDCNLGMMNRSGVLLQDHDDELEIGEVVRDSAKVEADKKTRATVKIEDAEWKTRVSNGDMPGVSVGYVQLSVLREEPEKVDGHPVMVFSWQPYEVSLLTGEPADRSVGINRGKKNRGKKYRCGQCRGSGECPDCEGEGTMEGERCGRCRGAGECDECDGEGILEGAKRKSPDSKFDIRALSNAQQILDVLTTEQTQQMRILLKEDPQGGGGSKIVTAEDERRRIAEIESVADEIIKDHGAKDGGKMRDTIHELAKQARGKETSVADFKNELWITIANAKPAEQKGIADYTSEREREEYSFGRAVQNAVMERANGKAGVPDKATTEGKVHYRMLEEANSSKNKEITGGLGFPVGGFMVPHDANISNKTIDTRTLHKLGRASRSTRDMQVDLFGQGGAMVPTQLLVPIIELLRNMMVLDKVGVHRLGGLQGNVVIPRQTAPATAYSVSEIGALTASNQTLDQIALTPKRVGATQNYSKQLVFQASPDAEAFLRDDLFKVIALNWDYLGFNGTGNASQPLGIINSPGIGGVTFGATPTYIKMVLFETTIRNANVMDEIAYVSTTATRGSLKTVAEALTGATTIGGRQNAIWQGGLEDGTVNYCKAIASNQIPGNVVVAGAFNHLIHAMWAGFDVVVDYFTKAVNAEVAITINTWGDFALRHPQAFAVSTDAGNQ
jgi:HK97 family phage major capsid protein